MCGPSLREIDLPHILFFGTPGHIKTTLVWLFEGADVFFPRRDKTAASQFEHAHVSPVKHAGDYSQEMIILCACVFTTVGHRVLFISGGARGGMSRVPLLRKSLVSAAAL